MGPKKVQDSSFRAPANHASPVPYDGPASRLRSRSSLSTGEPAIKSKKVRNAATQEPARKQNFEVVIWKRTPMQTPLKIRPKNKNTYAQTIISRWPVIEAREAVEQEIALHKFGYQTKDGASAQEKEVVSKMKWANRRLRAGYCAFIQKAPLAPVPATSSRHSESYLEGKSTNSNLCGSACQFPTCGASFQACRYRISFELPRRKTSSCGSKITVDLTHDTERELEGDTSIAWGDEKPTFFCLQCFDKLLMPYTLGETKVQPTDPFSHKLVENQKFQTPKPGYLRPSPSCRIYDRIRPETRSQPNEFLNLSPTEQEVIETWKAYNYNQGLSKLNERCGFMFSTGLAPDQQDCEVTGLDGIGIPEFLNAHFPENSVPYYSTKKCAPNRAPGELDNE